jgi:hypothetical protein
MNRFLSALITGAALLAFATPSFASTAMTAASPSAMAPMAHATPAGNHTCPKGQTYVKGYTKADGTKVKGYCRAAAAPMASPAAK